MRLQAPLWRAIAVFQLASLAYAAGLLVTGPARYAHPGWAWLILAGMTAWTVATTVAYAQPARRTWALLGADLALTAAALLSTALVQTPQSLALAAMPVTATWVAGPVLAWAVAYGMAAGLGAAIVLGGCDIALRHQLVSTLAGPAVNATILLLLAAVTVGYVSALAARAEQALQRAAGIEAASRERERLARGIHDSVLQVLALVQRRGAEVGGEAAEIGRLAGEQEAALRALIAGAIPAAAPGSSQQDLRALLTGEAGPAVTVVAPAGPVLLPAHAAGETVAAVRAALDNVRRHAGAGARAWVLIDDDGTGVNVTVRDDGPGIPPGRLAEAAAEGRLGVSQAICGRLRDLGGTADVTSVPGTGTEVRLRVPRVSRRGPA